MFVFMENSATNQTILLSSDHPKLYEILTSSQKTTPFHTTCPNCRPLETERNMLRQEAAYWRAMHQKALLREKSLKDVNEKLQAENKSLKQKLFGKKSEKGGKTTAENTPKSKEGQDNQEGRSRGQKKGEAGHGRRIHDTLPVEECVIDLPEGSACCPECGLPLQEINDTEDAEELVVEVKAHRRIIRRKKYKKTCSCPKTPAIVTAPPPPKLIHKGLLSIESWVTVILDKFLYLRPTNRLLTQLLFEYGANVAQGTITGGLKTLMPLFEPLYDAIIKKNASETLWHADETRWLVFEKVEGKTGYRWYMWVFRSQSTVVYGLDPSRCSAVVEAHLFCSSGILVVDRYGAYKVLLKTGRFVLAFCWAHVRRDFLSVAQHWPALQSWGLSWVDAIGEIYRLNDERLAAVETPQAFAEADERLHLALKQMEEKRQEQLQDLKCHPVCKKVLKSLERHWPYLITFVKHPEVPMDNNEAERCERTPAVGRKNFYGSGAVWSGQLTAMLFSILQTVLLFKINPKRWLERYLEACAQNGGLPPQNVAQFLPWEIAEDRLKALSYESLAEEVNTS
jgi:transposase